MEGQGRDSETDDDYNDESYTSAKGKGTGKRGKGKGITGRSKLLKVRSGEKRTYTAAIVDKRTAIRNVDSDVGRFYLMYMETNCSLNIVFDIAISSLLSSNYLLPIQHWSARELHRHMRQSMALPLI